MAKSVRRTLRVNEETDKKIVILCGEEQRKYNNMANVLLKKATETIKTKKK